MSVRVLRLAAVRKLIAESRSNHKTLLREGERALEEGLALADDRKTPTVQTRPVERGTVRSDMGQQIDERDSKTKRAIKATLANKDRSKIKQVLFETYQECAKTKRTDPKFMSRDNLVKHIRAERPDIVARAPQFYKMAKDDLCKEIMKSATGAA
jgi:hypothetical protein